MARNLETSGCFSGLAVPFQGSNKKFVVRTIPRKDGWDGPYIYTLISSDEYMMASSGPDRKFKTEDDIMVFADVPRIFSKSALMSSPLIEIQDKIKAKLPDFYR